MSKLIPLSQGQFAIVDDELFDWLNQWKWTFFKTPNGTGYAGRITGPKGNRKLILMHRLIAQTPEGLETDHIDRNKLNNQRHNLRHATHALNMQNKDKPVYRNRAKRNNKKGSAASSRFLGVCWHKRDRRWRADIRINRKSVHIGYFTDEIEAAKAYDAAAKQHFGESVYLNFPDQQPA